MGRKRLNGDKPALRQQLYLTETEAAYIRQAHVREGRTISAQIRLMLDIAVLLENQHPALYEDLKAQVLSDNEAG